MAGKVIRFRAIENMVYFSRLCRYQWCHWSSCLWNTLKHVWISTTLLALTTSTGQHKWNAIRQQCVIRNRIHLNHFYMPIRSPFQWLTSRHKYFSCQHSKEDTEYASGMLRWWRQVSIVGKVCYKNFGIDRVNTFKFLSIESTLTCFCSTQARRR